MSNNNQVSVSEIINKLNNGELNKIFESNSKLLSVMADLNGKFVYSGNFANLYSQYIYAIKNKNIWSFYLQKEELNRCTIIGRETFTDRKNVDIYIRECSKAIKIYIKICENISNLTEPYEFLHWNVVALYFNAYSKLLAQYRLTNGEYVNGIENTDKNSEDIINILAVNRINIRKEFMKGNALFAKYVLRAMGQTYTENKICDLTVDSIMNYYISNSSDNSQVINICCADDVSVKTFIYENDKLNINSDMNELSNLTKITGISASCTDLIRGKVILVNDNISDELINEEKNEPIIIVTRALHFDYEGCMKNVIGIICDEGGILSHAAIIARENNIACITSTRIATKSLKNEDVIEVDSLNGVITVIKRNNNKI